MSIRNDKFWDVSQHGELGKAILAFVASNDKTSTLSGIQQMEYAEELMCFIEQKKQTISDEVDREFHREDVRDKINEEWADIKNAPADIFPIEYLDKLVDIWQDDLGNNDGYWEDVWDTLRCVLQDESWWQDLGEYDKEAQLLYKCYLKDWFRMHEEGDPVCIEEFMSNEMAEEETAQYFRTLARKDSEWWVMEIIKRAKKEGIHIKDEEESTVILLKAKERFNLDVEGLLQACSFDFWHDVLEIHKHYHNETESFDNRFLPRYARDVHKGTQDSQAPLNKPNIELLCRRILPEDCALQLKILAYVQGVENIVFTEEEKAKIVEMRKKAEEMEKAILVAEKVVSEVKK